MAEVIQTLPKHPGNPDRTLDDVLHDVVQRAGFSRKLIRYTIRPGEVELVYETPA